MLQGKLQRILSFFFQKILTKNKAFAKITANHTDGSHMDFDREYHFDKVNYIILLTILPIVLIILVIMFIYMIFKRLLHR